LTLNKIERFETGYDYYKDKIGIIIVKDNLIVKKAVVKQKRLTGRCVSTFYKFNNFGFDFLKNPR